MGLIEKSVRKRSNQKLAAEVFTQTALSFDEVEAAVRRYCDAKNAEVTRAVGASQAKAKTRVGKWTANLQDPRNSHYYVSPHPEMRQILIGFGQRPEPILAGRGSTSHGVWAARLSYPAGGSTVGLILLKWVIGGNDGVLKNRGFYESLLENVHTAISSEAPRTSGGAPGPASSALPATAIQPPGDVSPASSPGSAAAPVPGFPQAPVERQAVKTAQVIQPQRARIGDWASDLTARFPFLERADILALAGMRALLAVDTGFYSSTYITERQFSASQFYQASTHSLLRCRWIMPGGTTYLDCGAPKPDQTFVSDWQLKYAVSEDGDALIEVPHYKLTNDGLRSGELLTQLREAVTATLASGIHLRLDEGPPVMDGLVVTMPAGLAGYPDNDNSPFGNDRLGGLTDVYREPLALPATARDAVLAAMTASHFRSVPGSGDVLCAASLAGGRPFDAGSVTLRWAGDNDQLVIDIPETLDLAERERSYRAALRCLLAIAGQLGESEPGISATVRAHAEHVGTDNTGAWRAAVGTRLRDRPAGLWLNNWDRSTAAPMVPIAAGRWYPIGIRVTTPTETNYLRRAAAAADWIGSFKRATPILQPNGRPGGRLALSARRCGPLYSTNDRPISCLRYAADRDVSDYSFTKVTLTQAWFWEVNARGTSASEPVSSSGGMLLVTGWSHADGVLGYGENLLSMLRAFAEVVSASDDEARVQTLYMAT